MWLSFEGFIFLMEKKDRVSNSFFVGLIINLYPYFHKFFDDHGTFRRSKYETKQSDLTGHYIQNHSKSREF